MHTDPPFKHVISANFITRGETTGRGNNFAVCKMLLGCDLDPSRHQKNLPNSSSATTCFFTTLYVQLRLYLQSDPISPNRAIDTLFRGLSANYISNLGQTKFRSL